MAKKQVSPEVAEEAIKVAKSTARPGQTKEQTKLIAQGIEKGIAEFKKREKAKARERDKERKKADLHIYLCSRGRETLGNGRGFQMVASSFSFGSGQRY